MRHRFFHALSVIIVLLGAILSGSSSHSQQSASTIAETSAQMAALEKTFTAALTRTASERRENNSTSMYCDWFFWEFSRVDDDVEIYKKFFASKEIDFSEATQNQRHRVYVIFSFKDLLRRGYFGFRLRDKLAISFTTESPESSKITSFTARIFTSK